MATGFNTQTGNDEYRLQFETDNKEHFLLMQETARLCVDGKPQTNADRIRAMSDEELVAFLGYNGLCDRIQNEGTWCEEHAVCEGCLVEWLKQPAEQATNDRCDTCLRWSGSNGVGDRD